MKQLLPSWLLESVFVAHFPRRAREMGSVQEGPQDITKDTVSKHAPRASAPVPPESGLGSAGDHRIPVPEGGPGFWVCRGCWQMAVVGPTLVDWARGGGRTKPGSDGALRAESTDPAFLSLLTLVRKGRRSARVPRSMCALPQEQSVCRDMLQRRLPKACPGVRSRDLAFPTRSGGRGTQAAQVLALPPPVVPTIPDGGAVEGRPLR